MRSSWFSHIPSPAYPSRSTSPVSPPRPTCCCFPSLSVQPFACVCGLELRDTLAEMWVLARVGFQPPPTHEFLLGDLSVTESRCTVYEPDRIAPSASLPRSLSSRIS